jgi:D-serine dehydratase
MRQFIAEYGMKLAPHGKTTMAPRLLQMQLDGGAWGITLATAHQTRIAHLHGVRRVLMANQLVGKQNMAIVSELLRDPAFEYLCLVDSAEQVELLGNYFRDTGQQLQVLIELGPEGGRAGVRDTEQLATLLTALDQWRGTISLTGVEVFEGVLDDEVQIRALLKRAVDLCTELLRQNRFDRQPPILTGAGSSWYDVVAEVFSSAGFGDQVEIVLRPGCYLTHDVGAYRRAQERILTHNRVAQRMHSGLLPALQVWAYVHSVPEKEKAIVSLGKRDAAFDSGLPAPVLHYRPGSTTPTSVPAHWNLTRMMDQHGFLEVREHDDIRVGDMIGFDISHPCLTFDKWRVLPILNRDYDVIDIVETYF